MLSPSCYSSLTYGSLLRNNLCTISPLFSYFAFGKIAENPVVTPNTTTQVVHPSAENRFLQSVTVNPIPTTTTTGG
jgi:hypothetical protein